MKHLRNHILLALLIMLFFIKPLLAGHHSVTPSVNVAIATGGAAQLSITIPAGASTEIQDAANHLALYLHKITGATFNITTGSGGTGIALGVIGSYPALSFSPIFDTIDPAERQGYEIKSHSNGIYIIGATTIGLNYAISDLLDRFGYRRYFPTDIWEIIPNKPDLSFDKHIREIPDYFTRRIFPGFSYWPEYRQSGADWDKVNRNGGYELRTSHVYDEIISNNIAAFNAHPEYYALVNGVRNSSKMCISNPDLRTLVVNYILGRFAANPSLDSYSMEPSDGPGWCECSNCAAIGSPSTRAVFLANTVAEAVRANYTGKKIGMYAYFQHSPAPEINVDQDVVVSVATSDRYLEGSEPVDSVLIQWQNKNAVLGIREYGDVLLWSKHLPGNSNASNFGYLTNSIKKYYNDYGARYHISQATDGWGGSGLGFYLSTKMMWNVNECDKIDSLKEDFFTNSFGPASVTMKNYYEIIDGTNPRLLSRDMIGRMYRQLDTARVQAGADTSILKRIGDMALYTHYCELYLGLTLADATDKQEEYNKLLKLIIDQKEARMIHSYEVYLHKRFSPSNGTDPSEQAISWSNPTRPSFAQIDSIIQNGIAVNNLVNKEDFSYVNQGQYEYRSIQSGNWNDLNSWEIYTGWAWEPANTVINPGHGSNINRNYTIRPADTITLSSGAAYCTNLNVMSGGVLNSNSNNYDLRIGSGELPYSYNSGIINNGVIDGLQAEVWTSTANMTIGGTGTYRLGMLRARGGNLNPLQITIDQDITLYLGSAVATFTIFKDDASNKTTDNYTLTLNSGRTINLTANAPFHMRGDKTNNPAGNYTYNINGTLDLSGATSRNSHFIASATNPNATSTLNINGNIILSKGFNTVSSVPTSGKIALNINNGTVNGATNKTLITTGTDFFTIINDGSLSKWVDNTNVNFPIGINSSTTYNPVILKNTGTPGPFSVSITGELDSFIPDSSKTVKREWSIYPQNTGSNTTISLGWLTGDYFNNFNPTDSILILRQVDTSWIESPAAKSGLGNIDNPYYATANFTSYGKFIIQNLLTALKTSSAVVLNKEFPERTKATVNAYPNPATNFITVTYPTSVTKGKVHMINLEGKKLLSQNIDLNSQYKSIDITRLIPGTYFIQLNNNNERSVIKLIKQ